MLDKRLQLGGLQVGGPRTAQNPARFRIANNVYQTRDGQTVPRADTASYQNTYTGATSLKMATRYKDKPFVLGYDGSKHLAYYESSAQIPGPNMPSAVGSLGVQAVEKLGNLYLNFPHKGLWKYDGHHAYRAGTPLPYNQILGSSSPIAFYVRTIQHHLDYQGNIVNSGYIETPAKYNSGSSITVRTDKGAPDSEASTRLPIEVGSEANGYCAYYLKVTNWALVSGNTYTLTTGGDHNVKDGVYLLWKVTPTTGNFGDGGEVRAVAYKVLSHTATTVTVGEPRYIDRTGSWQDQTTTVAAHPDIGDYLAFYWTSVWTCSVSTGNYVLQAIVPSCYESANNQTFTVTFANANAQQSPGFAATAFNLEGNLGDIYDVTSVKQIFPVTPALKPVSFSTYGDMALVSYDNEIYFSDSSLGGSFEMTEGAAFIAVGEGDDGNIQSVCGSSDFILVSRQFRNYYVSGNLPTANYRVTEITQTSLGCYSNESSIAVSSKIIFLNKQGVWALYSGGRCEEISFAIQGLFDNFANTDSFGEEAYFDIDSYPTYASDSVSNQWMKTRFDVNRNLLAFAIYGGGTGKALILNLNNGEFYTWSDFAHSVISPDIQDIFFLDGYLYHTQNGTGVAALYKEDKTLPYAATLATTWFTANQPSLEKKHNQIKMWGIINPSTQVSVSHCLDWDDTEIISDATYVNTKAKMFSHKKRLTSGNFQAISIQLDLSGKFQLEGLEIEWQPLQGEMKK